MNKIPASLQSVTMLLIHIFAVPVFFLVFILLYESRWMTEFLNAGNEMTTFNTLILTSILIGIQTFSRVGMFFAGKKHRLSWWQYTLWSFGEVFVFTCFAALYMALIYGTLGYFPALAKCQQLALGTLCFPYTVFALLHGHASRDRREIAVLVHNRQAHQDRFQTACTRLCNLIRIKSLVGNQVHLRLMMT